VEAFAIRTEPHRVLLLGNTEIGVSHAVFRFLENLGYRHFFQGKNWEVIPSQRTLSYNGNEADRPAVLSRRLFYGFGFFDEKSQRDFKAWKRHNLMAQSFAVRAGHAWEGVVQDNKAVFEAHPEYFALVKQKDGTLKRQGPMLDLGNAALRQLVVEWALEYFRKNPTVNMLSVEPADGVYVNESPESKVYGASASDQIFGLANEVARAVRKEFPGKMIGLLAYSNHSDPPSFALEENIYVQLTRGFNDSARGLRFEDLLRLWSEKTRHLGVYTYLSVWPSDFDKLPGYDSRVARQMREYAQRSFSSVDIEASNNWGSRGLNYYLANRVLWDARADANALLQDFYGKAFGPAAPVMKRYYERLDAATVLLSRATLRAAMEDLDEAAKLAAGNDAVQARLDDLKGYHVFLDLREQFDAIPKTDKVARKAAALALLHHSYRTRHSYMEHYRAMSVDWVTQELAPELDEPSWKFVSGSFAPRPWEYGEPYTHAELQQKFEAAKARYPLVPVQTRTFSNDLVPVRFPTAKPAPGVFSSDEFRLALYSLAGEALEFEVTPAKSTAAYTVSYTVTDREGALIAQAQLPADGEKHAVKVAVPHAGLYFLDYNAPRLGGSIVLAAGQRGVWDLNSLSGGTASLPPRYFYVPKGTTEIQFLFLDPEGRPITFAVRSPDDSVNQLVHHKSGATGQVYKVPVPPGEDGKVWWLDSLAMGRLRFFNLPNYLAASPDALLVPSELAKRDGLEIAAP
jgi:hypothetical protein